MYFDSCFFTMYFANVLTMYFDSCFFDNVFCSGSNDVLWREAFLFWMLLRRSMQSTEMAQGNSASTLRSASGLGVSPCVSLLSMHRNTRALPALCGLEVWSWIRSVANITRWPATSLGTHPTKPWGPLSLNGIHPTTNRPRSTTTTSISATSLPNHPTKPSGPTTNRPPITKNQAMKLFVLQLLCFTSPWSCSLVRNPSNEAQLSMKIGNNNIAELPP